jgi:hypothetical protein
MSIYVWTNFKQCSIATVAMFMSAYYYCSTHLQIAMHICDHATLTLRWDSIIQWNIQSVEYREY